MDYSYIFRSGKIKKDSLIAAGFSTTDGDTYTKFTTVSNDTFNANIALSLLYSAAPTQNGLPL